jgi:hypothetical protein
LSKLTFARLIQLIDLTGGVGLLVSASQLGDGLVTNALFIFMFIPTAMILVALKCPRCGYSLYRTKNYRINLLVPASRVCAYCQTRRD